MEMCYDGALVMPNNYAVVDEEEMTYVDGGFSISNDVVGGAINLGITILCTAMGASFAREGARCLNVLIQAGGRKAVESVIKEQLERVLFWNAAAWVCAAIPNAMTLFGYILDPGNAIANWIDSKDCCPNNGRLDV